jgi:hypothetical protein
MKQKLEETVEKILFEVLVIICVELPLDVAMICTSRDHLCGKNLQRSAINEYIYAKAFALISIVVLVTYIILRETIPPASIRYETN